MNGRRLEVRDHGRGIPEGDLPHVFDRFYRSVEARTEPGSGLGLAIVKQTVERQGGTVWATTRPTGGAAVGFELPAGARGRRRVLTRAITNCLLRWLRYRDPHDGRVPMASTVLADVAASTSYAAPRRAARRALEPAREPGAVLHLDGGLGARRRRDDRVGRPTRRRRCLRDERRARCRRCALRARRTAPSSSSRASRAPRARSASRPSCTAVRVDAEPPSDGLYGAPARDGHGVHVIGDRGLVRVGRS